MPGYNVPSGSIALSASATKTLILVNPVVCDFKIREIDISFDGSSSAQGIRLDLYRVSTLGTPAGTAATPAQDDERSPAAQSTALTALTAEPAAVIVLYNWTMQQLGGLLPLPFPYGWEPIGKGGGNRIGLRAVTPAGVTPNCCVNFGFEE